MENNSENKCKRCGVCCHKKIKFNNKVHIFMNSPCAHLCQEIDGKYRCEIYENRLSKSTGCISLDEAIKTGVLPECCGYRDEFPSDYVFPIIVNSLKDLTIVK